jgi:glycosyltransferase involved in cell wall biosynthesis
MPCAVRQQPEFHPTVPPLDLDPNDAAEPSTSGGSPSGHVYPGARERNPARRCVLLVGHHAGPVLCGAERSLLDLLDGFATIGIDTVVAVPTVATSNPGYLADLVARTTEVHLVDVPWRYLPDPPSPSVVEEFARLAACTGVDAVAVNSIVVREPLDAARQLGLPTVVHAREVPPGAPDLCALLGGTAAQVVSSVVDDADWIIAPNRSTALVYPGRARVSVVPGAVEPDAFPVRTSHDQRPRVAIVGSVTAAKGVPEFLEVARRLERRTDARFVVIGHEVEDLRQLAGVDGIPSNVVVTGALATPQDAMDHADIVVSASRSTESFGRVVLEAMASGLPVVAFAHGGPTELVVDGVTGFLVPPGDLDALAERISELCDDPGLRRSMGQTARERAVARFSPDDLAVALAASYRAILPDADVCAARAADLVVHFPTDNRSHFRHPFFVGNRARFATVTDVRFLDDTRLLTASLLGKRMWLLRVDPATGATEILDEQPTIGTDGEVSVDLLDIDENGRIATSDCEVSSVTLYHVATDRIVRSGTVPVTDADAGYCHGVALIPGRPDVVVACITTGNTGVHLVDVETTRTRLRITDGNWIPKSAAFLDHRTLVVAWVTSNIGHQPHDRYEAKLSLVRLTRRWDRHRVLAEVALPGTSLDGITYRHGTILASAQADDAVLAVRVGRRSLRRRPDVVGFNLPHGADVSPDRRWLAVASYGDDAVVLRRLRSSHR